MRLTILTEDRKVGKSVKEERLLALWRQSLSSPFPFYRTSKHLTIQFEGNRTGRILNVKFYPVNKQFWINDHLLLPKYRLCPIGYEIDKSIKALLHFLYNAKNLTI